MAEAAAPLTTETYTHEEAIARIAELEAAADNALEALEAGQTDDAIALLAAVFDDECELEDEEEDDDEEEDVEDF